MLPSLGGQPTIIDASLTFLNKWHSPIRMFLAAANPSTLRFVVVLPDPVDRLYSHWNQMVSSGKETSSFGDYVSDSV